MSLAMYAAPFDNENNDSYDLMNESLIAKKKNIHNKTQKRNEYNTSQKVNAVLETIHNKQEDNDLGDFNPLNPPTSVGVENTKLKEGMSTNQSSQNDNIDINSLKTNFLNDKAVEKYYKNLIPNYNNNPKNDNFDNYSKISNSNIPYYKNNYNESEPVNFSENYLTLVEKLNYMINLLEEQQDQKTNNVTEEVVMFSFLGIFIIFIVDSFARAGKYVR